MNLLDRGSRWLSTQMAQHAGTRVVYRRGSKSILLTEVVKFRREVEVIDEDGMPTKIQVFEFRCMTEDFIADDIVPRPGDLMTEIAYHEESHYEVMPTQGLPAIKDAANDQHWLSILTKRIC